MDAPVSPLLPLLLAASVVAVVPQPQDAPAQPDYVAQGRSILAAELARVVGSDACVDPSDLPAGVIPSTVVVSAVTGDMRLGEGAGWASNTAERMPLDVAWSEAEAGRVVVRCVIVERNV